MKALDEYILVILCMLVLNRFQVFVIINLYRETWPVKVFIKPCNRTESDEKVLAVFLSFLVVGS